MPSSIALISTDRDGGALVLATLFSLFPFLTKLFTDGGYQGEQFRTAQMKALPNLKTQIVKRSDTASGFEVLPRRWVVERTFAWLNRCRRLAKDWEQSIESSTAWVTIASIRVMTRRLATYCYVS